jgi:hypothetical protein
MDQVTLPMGVDAMAMLADTAGCDRPTALMKAIALHLSASALAMIKLVMHQGFNNSDFCVG